MSLQSRPDWEVDARKCSLRAQAANRSLSKLTFASGITKCVTGTVWYCHAWQRLCSCLPQPPANERRASQPRRHRPRLPPACSSRDRLTTAGSAGERVPWPASTKYFSIPFHPPAVLPPCPRPLRTTVFFIRRVSACAACVTTALHNNYCVPAGGPYLYFIFNCRSTPDLLHLIVHQLASTIPRTFSR